MLYLIVFADRTVLFEEVCCTYLNASMYICKYDFYWFLSNVFERSSQKHLCSRVTQFCYDYQVLKALQIRLNGKWKDAKGKYSDTGKTFWVSITEQILLCPELYTTPKAFWAWLGKDAFVRMDGICHLSWAVHLPGLVGTGIASSLPTYWGFFTLASGKGTVDEYF